MPKLALRPAIYRSIPWILFGVVLMPAVATGAVGILVLVLADVPGSIALGILTICFAVFALAGTFVTLGLLRRQNRLAIFQTEFVANVSHELRTPLASIRMYVDTLRMGRVRTDKDREDCLAALDKETARLVILVEQLLGFRASSSGASGLVNRNLVSVPDLVEEAVQPFTSRPGQGQRVSLVVEPALPTLWTSRSGFVEALSNLIQNALTHGGGSGPVVVTARADHRGVAFSVRDSGPGISDKDRKKVFDRFYRGKSTTDGLIPGFGLGLSIVRRFAQDHGGKVELKSAPGHGSIFTLWLPASGDALPEGSVTGAVHPPGTSSLP